MAFKKTKLLIVLLILVVSISSGLAALKTFHIQETDYVKVTPEAVDADEDNVIFYYSPPLDENGEWQTGYDDAGEYPLTIIASDGINQTEEEILLIVDNKNQAPYLTEKKITIKEKQTIDLKQIIVDPDQDPLDYVFNTPFDNSGVWETSYEDAGSFVTEFLVNDGEYDFKARVEIEVRNTNQPPKILDSFSESRIVLTEEDHNLNFYVEAVDGDGDELTYTWKLDGLIVSEVNSCTHYFDFDSSGGHNLTLIISDGQREVIGEWELEVENVNRAPELNLLPVTVNETQLVKLELPRRDLDGDVVEYSFKDKFDQYGEWQTNYDDSGIYKIYVYASDGDLETKQKLELTVNDVDRAPELNIPYLEVSEEGKLNWEIDTSDLDGDLITVTLEGSPEGSIFDGSTRTLTWEPGYDFIRRKGGVLSNILNSLRLENRLLRVRNVPIQVTSCGKDLCTTKLAHLKVLNINRPPVLEKLNNITVSETNSVELSPQYSDPDGDIVRLTYSNPLKKWKGTWETNYDSEGKHIVYMAATDGELTTTNLVNLRVLKTNREPTLEIKNDEIVVNEGQEFSFSLTASDPDKDELSLSLENLPPGASFTDGVFSWQPSYETVKNGTNSWTDELVSEISYINKKFNTEEEVRWLNFVASDGEFSVTHPVKLTVKNINQEPQLLDYLPLNGATVRVGQPVVFHVTVKDVDADKLNYQWSFGLIQQKVSGTDTIERTFLSPGKKDVKVTVSDGSKEVSKEWSINVLEEEYSTIPVSFDPGEFKVYVIKS
jgi:hypothetical protein